MATFKEKLHPAWRNYWFSLILVGIFLLFSLLSLGALAENEAVFGGPLAIAIAIFLFVAYRKYSWEYTIDENRVTRHHGIISRNQQSVRIKDLRSVELNQSFFQRIFNTGDVSFYSAGSGNAEVIFFGIANPQKYRDKIDNAMDRLKDSSGE